MIIQVIPDNCTGCRACEEFCPIEQEGYINPELSRIKVYKDLPHNLFLPVVCVPCDEKPCLQACPEPGAMRINPATGAVEIIEENCTGCSKCIRACSIGAIHFLRQDGRGKLGKAVAIKCNQCGGDPWCVKVCQPGALHYVEESAELSGQVVFTTLESLLDEAKNILALRGASKGRK
jgi:anaerobic carbon-monoxide dehydrogenase iron sulfur subunit